MNGRAYYNENDPFAVDWLRQLIALGLIEPGHVDQRSVVDVRAADLDGFERCHFFAGIGGWPHALDLAGASHLVDVWTASIPCQPLSVAGLQQGHADERHLWPAFQSLVSERRPAAIFGEQVASADGREWLAGIRADLEALGYACGAADLCAASEGAPHIRQRLYWLAHAGERGRPILRTARLHEDGAFGHDDAGCRAPDRLGDAERARLERHAGHGDDGHQPGRLDTLAARSAAATGGARFWDAFDLIACSDGKARRTQPGIHPLAHGVSGRVGRLRGYGNAIVPQVAARFLEAALAAIGDS